MNLENYLPYSCQEIDEDDIKAVSNALKDSILTGGDKITEFENNIANYVGAKYAVALNSATSALHLAYLALGLKEGDEIITTPMTFAATANAALMCGAKVKFAGILEDGNIDPKSIEKLITPKTKIITPVDFGGKIVNFDKISKIAKKHDLKVIEDASHALGSKKNRKFAGTFGDIGIFSFHPVKPITTLEGGMIVTNDEKIASKARLLRSHGIIHKEAWDSDMMDLGFNYRISDVSCALGNSQLKKLDKFIAKRNEIAKFYDEIFENNEFFDIVEIEENELSSRHLYIIKLKEKLWDKKLSIFKALKARNIGVQVHYKPTYKFSFYEKLYGKNEIKSVEDFYKSELSIPCNQKMDLKVAKIIADNLFEICKNS